MEAMREFLAASEHGDPQQQRLRAGAQALANSARPAPPLKKAPPAKPAPPRLPRRASRRHPSPRRASACSFFQPPLPPSHPLELSPTTSCAANGSNCGWRRVSKTCSVSRLSKASTRTSTSRKRCAKSCAISRDGPCWRTRWDSARPSKPAWCSRSTGCAGWCAKRWCSLRLRWCRNGRANSRRSSAWQQPHPTALSIASIRSSSGRTSRWWSPLLRKRGSIHMPMRSPRFPGIW